MLNTVKKLFPRRLFRALQPAYHFIMGWLAALFYRFPSRKLIIIGVTGTAGKTSLVYLIAKMLSSAGYKTGFTSTTVLSDGDHEWLNDKKMTMPGRSFVQKILRRMVANGCRYAIVETTSEGIKQFRHRFINYDVVVFTSLYPEHIESHGSFEKYKEAKGRLFSHLKRGRSKYINAERVVSAAKTGLKKLELTRVKKTIIVNGDDAEAEYFLNFWSEAKVVFSFNPQAEAGLFIKNLAGEARVDDFSLVRGGQVTAGADGTKLEIDGQELSLLLLGEFNATNALAAYAVGLNQSLPFEIIKLGLESVKSLAGKMERIDAGQDFQFIVDYSFEPKALEKLYSTIDLIPHNRLIHILGSTGGGRDKARRPILGRLAGAKADLVVVTNEDPYDEDPQKIIDQVAAGAEEAGKQLGQDLFMNIDRREAINKALELAKKGDLVLLTGKGAEQAICVAHGRKIPWDDREAARIAIVDKMCIDKK
jgi:UDP-N-acetylmuramoyl-L-alanyl-D-glutamate--2,6-diaminopimelate ligase